MVLVKPHNLLQHAALVTINSIVNSTINSNVSINSTVNRTVHSAGHTGGHPVIGAIDAVVGTGQAPLMGGSFHPAAAPLPEKPTGWTVLILQATLWLVFWFVLFYTVSYCWPLLKVKESSYPHENNPYWCAKNVTVSLMSAAVGVVAVVAQILLMHESSYIQFGSSNNLAFCAVDSTAGADLQQYQWSAELVAMAGLAFTTYTLSDIIISLVHGLAELDYIVHHMAFVCAGAIIRSNCMLPLNASILLAMEISTPCLNWVLIFRHREGYSNSTMVASILFTVSFLVTRVGFNTYGAIILWVYREKTMPPTVPLWTAWSLIFALSVGVAIQFFWLPPIIRALYNIFNKKGSKGDKAALEAAETAKEAALDRSGLPEKDMSM